MPPVKRIELAADPRDFRRGHAVKLWSTFLVVAELAVMRPEWRVALRQCYPGSKQTCDLVRTRVTIGLRHEASIGPLVHPKRKTPPDW